MPRSRPVDPVVEELRARLEAIDRSLVLGLRAREQTQQELFAYKRSAALALQDVEQERLVQHRARAWAEEYGADPDLVEDVIDRAVQAGKRRFLSVPSEAPSSGAPVVVFVPIPATLPSRAAAPPRHSAPLSAPPAA